MERESQDRVAINQIQLKQLKIPKLVDELILIGQSIDMHIIGANQIMTKVFPRWRAMMP